MIRRQLDKAVGSSVGFIITSVSSWITSTSASSCCHNYHQHPNHHRPKDLHNYCFLHTQVLHWKNSVDDDNDDDGNIRYQNGRNKEEGEGLMVVGRHISFSPFIDQSSSQLLPSHKDNDTTASTTTVSPAPALQQALTVNDTTRASTAIQHLRNGCRLIYTGGDYHNARQLLRAVKRKITQTSSSSSSSSLSSSTFSSPTRTRTKDCNHDDHDAIRITNRQWIEAKQLQRIQLETMRGILIQVSLDALLHNNDHNSAIVPPGGIMGLKRTPINSTDVLRYAFKNEDIMMNIKMTTTLATTATTNATTSTTTSTTTAKNDDGDTRVDTLASSTFLLSLSEFIGMMGGYEWYRKGVYIHAIQEYIYPHYGVFPPTRQDYISLLDNIVIDGMSSCNIGTSSSESSASGDQRDGGEVDAKVDIPIMHRSRSTTMLEVGIGSGILSIILLKQGKVDHVTGTDINPYAIACARDNMKRLGLECRTNLIHTDLFPSTSVDTMGYDVVLFNPPWLPHGEDAPSTYLDQAVYDSNHMVLRRFICQVQHHVNREDGYIYILLSNLGMLLGLFREQDLHDMFDEGNLELVEVYNNSQPYPTAPADKGKKKGRRRSLVNNSMTADDELQSYHKFYGIARARAQEVISLYKLRVKRSR